ncbi:MAG: hypothetical protein N2444_08735, partial [Methylocystis sp.]|nr:hypothetical protein [Methylocystis sp.]
PCTIDLAYDPDFAVLEGDPHGGESDCKSAACAALKREALALAQAVHRAPLDARKAALAKLSEAQRKAFEALEKRAPTPGHSEPLKPAEQNDPSNYTDVAPLLTPLVYKDEVLLANVGHTTMGWRTYPDWSVKLQKLEKDQLTEVGEILVSMAPVRLRKATIR